MPSECQPCEGIEPRTPESVASRPGLPALRYRAGRHSTFLESMIAGLSAVYAKRQSDIARDYPDPRSRPGPPNWLHTRETTDPTIAFLDAWATVGDVLTFYQERIANEGYLKTARERRSLHELANQVGYQLRPALSASVYLAFDVQAPPSLATDVKIPPPHEVRIPEGTQAKSVPEPGQLPALFETTSELLARPEWNSLNPKRTTSTIIDIGGPQSVGNAHEINRLRFHRMDHNLKPGDLLLLEGRSLNGARPSALTRQIRFVTLDTDRGQTVVELASSAYSFVEYQRRVADASSRFQKAMNSIQLTSTGLTALAKAWIDKSNEVSGPILRLKMHEADRTVWTAAKALESDSQRWNSPESDTANLAPHNQYQAAIKAFEAGVTGPESDSLRTLVSTLLPTLLGDGAVTAMEVAKTNASLLKSHLDLLANSDNDLLTAGLSKQEMHDLVTDLEKEVETISTPEVTRLLKEFHKQLREAADINMDDGMLIAKVETSLQTLVGNGTSLAVDQARATLAPGSGSVLRIHQRRELLKQPPWSDPKSTNLGDIEEAVGVIEDEFLITSKWSGTAPSPLLLALCTDLSTAWKAARDRRVQALKLAITGIGLKLAEYKSISKSDADSILKDLEPPPEDLKSAVPMSRRAIGIVAVRSAQIYVSATSVKEASQAADALLRDWRSASSPIVDSVEFELVDLQRRFPDQTSPPYLDVKRRIDAIRTVDESLKDAIRKINDNTLDVATRKKAEEVVTSGRLIQALNSLAPTDDAAIADAERTAINNRVNRLSTSLKVDSNRGGSRPQSVVGTIGSDDDLSSLITFSGSRPSSSASQDVLEGNSGVLGGLIGRLGGRDEQNRFNAWGRRKADVSLGKVYAFRVRASLFGASLPQRLAIKVTTTADGASESKDEIQDPIVSAAPDEGSTVLYLDHDYPDLVAGGWCLIGRATELTEGKKKATGLLDDGSGSPSAGLPLPFSMTDAVKMQRNAYLLSNKTVRLTLSEEWQPDPKQEPSDPEQRKKYFEAFLKRLRSTVVFAGSTELPLADELIETPFPGPDTAGAMTNELSEDKKRYRPTDGIDLAEFHGDLIAGRELIFVGEQVVPRPSIPEGVPTNVELTRICRVATARSQPDNGGTRILTTLTVDPPLDVRFKRDTVRIYGNVVRATHGETQQEVLGSGEGQGEFQQFALSQRKLTYLPEATSTGMAPQVSVLVNNVAWARAEKVGDMQPEAGEKMPQEYLVTVDDDQRAILTTGDGKTTGERLPTGVANVRVEYRVGGGTTGNVKEGTITQLPSPPLNVTKVRNLLPASGGVDRENVDQARGNIPVAAMALDRLLSMRDYESFVRKFAGIAKAEATSLMIGGVQTVVVTIAGLGDAPIERDSLLFTNLDTALRRHSDPEQSVILLVRELTLLILKAKVKIFPDRLWKTVREEIVLRLLREFDFEKARLGGSVLLSDIVTVIQETPGVRYVDVDVLDRMRQLYGAGELVRKAACIAASEGPKVEVKTEAARTTDIDEDELILRPQGSETVADLLAAKSFDPAKDFLISERVSDGNDPDRRVIATVSMFPKSNPQRPPGAPADGPAPFPAQLAYFTDLPGTILLEQIP